MKHVKTLIQAFLFVAAAVPGCAPMTEAEIEHLQHLRAEHKQEFIVFRDMCSAAGGRIVMEGGQYVDRNRIPSRGATYYCADRNRVIAGGSESFIAKR